MNPISAIWNGKKRTNKYLLRRNKASQRYATVWFMQMRKGKHEKEEVCYSRTNEQDGRGLLVGNIYILSGNPFRMTFVWEWPSLAWPGSLSDLENEFVNIRRDGRSPQLPLRVLLA